MRAEWESIVGKEMYRCWIKQLKQIAKSGRTHELRVVVAGMLTYTWDVGYESETYVIRGLQEIVERYPSNYANGLKVVKSLLQEAGIDYEKTSSKGYSYSLANESCDSFTRWGNMPWEH